MPFSEAELLQLNSQLMQEYIQFMYNYFTDPQHQSRLQYEGLGRVSGNQGDILATIKNAVIPRKFNIIKDDPYLIIGIFKFLANNPELNNSTLLLTPNSTVINAIYEITRTIDLKNIPLLQEKILPILQQLKIENPTVYNCMFMLFNLCYQISQYSEINKMSCENIIIAMQSIPIICGLATQSSKPTAARQLTDELQQLSIRNAIFTAFINIFQKKECIMADELQPIPAIDSVPTEYTSEDELLIQQGELSQFDIYDIDVEDSRARADVMITELLNNTTTDEQRLTIILAELQRDIIIDKTIVTALPNFPQPAMPFGLEKKIKDIYDTYIEKLIEQQNILQRNIAAALQAKFTAIMNQTTQQQAAVQLIEALHGLRHEIESTTPEIQALLPGGSAQQYLTNINAKIESLTATISIQNAALTLQARLADIAETHDPRELNALIELRRDITNAISRVQELLPGGNANLLLASINDRINPLTIALALQARLANIAETHDPRELNALIELHEYIINASLEVQALLPGGNANLLLASINARITPLAQAVALQARLAGITITHDPQELEALIELRRDITNAIPAVQALLLGGDAQQLLARIDARITPLAEALALQARLADIAETHDPQELEALIELRRDITNAIPSVQALLLGGDAQQLLASIDARINPLAQALALQARLAGIAVTHDPQELEALIELRRDITNAIPAVQALLLGGDAQQLLARIDARITPLAEALALQARLADIAETHDPQELEALIELRRDITNAIPSVQALLLGGDAQQLLASIDARINPLAQALALQARLAGIAVTHDPQELDALTTLRQELTNASLEIQALLLGGSAQQLLARIDARINPLTTDLTTQNAALSLQTRLNAIAQTKNQLELNALMALSRDITNAIPAVQALLPGGNANQLLARVNARIVPLNIALTLQSRLANIPATKDQRELDALSILRQDIVSTNREVQTLFPGGNINTFLARIDARITPLRLALELQTEFNKLGRNNTQSELDTLKILLDRAQNLQLAEFKQRLAQEIQHRITEVTKILKRQQEVSMQPPQQRRRLQELYDLNYL